MNIIGYCAGGVAESREKRRLGWDRAETLPKHKNMAAIRATFISFNPKSLYEEKMVGIP